MDRKTKKRKADVVAGTGSFAGGLRKRRQAIESGRPELASEAYQEGISKKKQDKSDFMLQNGYSKEDY